MYFVKYVDFLGRWRYNSILLNPLKLEGDPDNNIISYTHDRDGKCLRIELTNSRSGYVTIIFLDREGYIRSFYETQEGKMSGMAIRLYKTGQVESIGMLSDSSKDGKWRYFYPSGKMEKEEEYVSVELTDENIMELINSMGSESWGGEKASLRNGEWRFWDDNGKLYKREWYDRGTLIRTEEY